jgi:membrane protein
MLAFLRTVAVYLAFVARRFVEDRCLTVAGSLTFTTLLALVPLFTVTVTLTSKLSYTRGLILQLKNFVLQNFVPEMSSRMIGIYVDQFAANASRLTFIGLLVVLISAIALLFTIENAFNAIWRTRRQRLWSHRLRWAAALLFIGPLLIAASLSLTVYFVRLTRALDSTMPWLDDVLLRSLPIAATTILLYFAYRWIPNRFVPARHALLGAIAAALMFELMKALFVVYVVKVATFSVVYGAFSSLPIFLLWLFCCWMVVLIGAELAATLSYVRHREAHESPAALEVDMARVEDALLAAALPRTLEQIRMAAPMPIACAEDALEALVQQGRVRAVEGRPRRYQVSNAIAP